MNYLQVKNWDNFQHYKERNPPWIKLHRDLLRDYEFMCLQDASKLHLMLIWLLASQLDNKIPADENFIKNQIGVSGKINFNELIDKGFLIDASNTLASCKQSAMPETEAYSKETEKDIAPILSKMNFTIIPSEWLITCMKEKGFPENVVLDIWDGFREYWQNGKGKSVKREKWDATWRTWYRGQNIKGMSIQQKPKPLLSNVGTL